MYMPNVTASQNGMMFEELAPASSSNHGLESEFDREKDDFCKTILKKLNPEVFQNSNNDEVSAKLRPQILEFVQKNISSQFSGDVDRMGKEICSELFGLGPLESLMLNDEITEIMVNGPDKIFSEKAGKIVLTSVQFQNESHLRFIIEQIVNKIGRRIDERSPTVDARLSDGSRVNVVIPPAVNGGSSITIRRFSQDLLSAKSLIQMGSLSEDMFQFLQAAVGGSLNIIISGGTGAGKTTLLNMLSNFIPPHERIVSIEDTIELTLQHENFVSLEAVQADRDGNNSVSIGDLMKNSLRMRPDRIVVGECRGKEALDMLQAMNTGHDGSMSTIHANTPRDAISRIVTMTMMAGYDLPERAILHQIASAIDLIVQISRLPDGSRKVTQITELTGMEVDTITMQDIYTLEWKMGEDEKVIGQHRTTGIRPHCADKLVARGQTLPKFTHSSSISSSPQKLKSKDVFRENDDVFIKRQTADLT
jgi:pilus assembly protein CpaF